LTAVRNFVLDHLELGVDRDEVGQLLGRHPADRLAYQDLGSHGREQPLGLQGRHWSTIAVDIGVRSADSHDTGARQARTVVHPIMRPTGAAPGGVATSTPTVPTRKTCRSQRYTRSNPGSVIRVRNHRARADPTALARSGS
jgi:hypothetical protein